MILGPRDDPLGNVPGGQELEAQRTPLGWPSRFDPGRSRGALRGIQGHPVEKSLGMKKPGDFPWENGGSSWDIGI